jgi:hypothetical protein
MGINESLKYFPFPTIRIIQGKQMEAGGRGYEIFTGIYFREHGNGGTV